MKETRGCVPLVWGKGKSMNSFNVGGFGWDEDGWSVALGVVSVAWDKDAPKCLFGVAWDTHNGFSLDLFWMPVL